MGSFGEKIAAVPTDHGMTRRFTMVYAMLPVESEFRGLVAGPREADPIRSPDWVAWARGPKGERVEVKAPTAEGAMSDLPTSSARSGPDPNG